LIAVTKLVLFERLAIGGIILVADRAALFIAVETFFEAAPPIAYAASDAAELFRTLPGVGYDPKKCFLLAGTRTTKSAIESHLARLPRLIGKADSLLVMVVSRAFSQKGRGYLVCADTILPDLAGTSLPLAELVAAVAKTKCKESVFLLDLDPLTIAGELVPSGLDEAELRKLFDGTSTNVALLACEPGERSLESGQLRHGIWRHHLIEAFSGKVRSCIGKDGMLTAAALQAYLQDAVPRTLRRSYETPQEQTPRLMGETDAEFVIADLTNTLEPSGELLNPARMKRVVFRAETVGRVKDLSGYRKSHSLPDRANQWARKYVNRIAAADIKSDLDSMFDMIREEFGYKRKDLDVSAERDGLGFIRTPEFEYTISLNVNASDPTEVSWRREVGRLSGPEFVRSSGFQSVFAPIFDHLVFEFVEPVDVADFVDKIEEKPIEGVKVSVASDANAAEVALLGFSGKITVEPEAVIIHGQTGNPASLLEQFLVFLRKFNGIGESKTLLG
jgi:hypothetical protein